MWSWPDVGVGFDFPIASSPPGIHLPSDRLYGSLGAPEPFRAASGWPDGLGAHRGLLAACPAFRSPVAVRSRTMASLFDENVYDPIGRVVVEWSHLRRRSADAYHLILNRGTPPVMNDTSRKETADLLLNGIDRLWKETKRLLRDGDHPQEELEWFTAWVTRAKELKRQRNDVDHVMWGTNGDVEGPSAMAVDTIGPDVFSMGGDGIPGMPRWDLFPDPVRRLRELAAEIRDHHNDLAQWTARQWRRMDPVVADAPMPTPTGNPHRS